MSWLIDFFTSIGQLVLSLIQFIVDTFTSIIQLILLIPEYISYMASMIAILPTWIIVFLTGIVTIHVIWTIRRAV